MKLTGGVGWGKLRCMYYIFIDNKENQSTESMQIAFANYRALCRDFKNKQSKIVLMLDSNILHAKEAGLMLLDDVDETTNNQLLVLLMKKFNVDIKELKSMLKKTEVQLSNSRIDGWIRQEKDRKYVHIHNDELYIVIEQISKNRDTQEKTSKNIALIRKQLKLTQKQLAEKLGMSATHRQVARWEAGEAEMPDKKWQSLKKMQKEQLNT